jgi:aryl-alcohol dehydrogenase-like predicted oxidoreductase
MEYVNLGSSGLKVSRIALGCMSYDIAGKNWHLDEKGGRGFIKQALELGINFFDTANMYSTGESEEVLGRAIRDFARREEIVIATKIFFPMRNDSNGSGLSRKSVMHEIDASLKRLGTDYVDLYQIHRWDYHTPVEETLEALHDIVKAGKARYLGASSMFAWQFCKALHLADLHGWTRFVSMQPHYNLINREEEREMLPLCKEEGIGVIPWSPLARGRLARQWQAASGSDRPSTDQTAQQLYSVFEESDKKIVDHVGEIANRHGIAYAQVALAWLLQKPGITAPIIGATNLRHLDDAVCSLDVKLEKEEIELLEADYVPHTIVGYE